MALTEDFFHKPDQKMIRDLIKATSTALQNISSKICPLNFIKPLFNQACVMLEGVPLDDSLLQIMMAIVESCKKSGIPVKLPWGCHSTISRFTESVPPEKLNGFFQLIEETREEVPFAQTAIEAIGVGYCTASVKEGFNLYLEKAFNL